MKHRQNNWRLFLVLSLVLGLIIYFQSFLITNIIEPIAVLFWALWRIIVSVHQNYYWTILILISSMLLVRFLPFRKNAAGLAYREEQSATNRVADWLQVMQDASDGTGETEYLRASLERLLISIYRVDRCHSMKVDEAVMPEAALLPETVHRFLFPEKKKHNFRLDMLLLMSKSFRKWTNRVFQIRDIPIEETLAWMESMVEISNDQ